jgi:hypothetical protein
VAPQLPFDVARALRQLPNDAVEKVAARRFQSAGEKIDLSDRPTNRSRTSVKDKKTPENLARKSVSDFFNSIELEGPLEEPSRAAGSLGLFDACPCPRTWGRATARAGRRWINLKNCSL